MVQNPPAVQESWVQSLGGEDPLEKGLATHSSILVWKIIWTEEHGRLQSTGSQRVGINRATSFPFPGGSDGKESTCNEGDPPSIPGLGRSPGEGNSYPYQYSCLKNSMDRGAWQAPVHGVAELDMTERLSVYFTFTLYSLLPLLVDQELWTWTVLLISVFTLYSKNCTWEQKFYQF